MGHLPLLAYRLHFSNNLCGGGFVETSVNTRMWGDSPRLVDFGLKIEIDMEWKSIETPPIGYGWYAVALNPVNWKDFHGANDPALDGWRKSFGFEKGWFNDGRCWVADYHGSRSMEGTDRVTHWAKLPDVP